MSLFSEWIYISLFIIYLTTLFRYLSSGFSWALQISFPNFSLPSFKTLSCVWNILWALSNPPQRGQNIDHRPLWLVFGNPSTLGLAPATSVGAVYSGDCHCLYLIHTVFINLDVFVLIFIARLCHIRLGFLMFSRTLFNSMVWKYAAKLYYFTIRNYIHFNWNQSNCYFSVHLKIWIFSLKLPHEIWGVKHEKRLLLSCIHNFKSDLINNMDTMHISSTKPSSVILRQKVA